MKNVSTYVSQCGPNRGHKVQCERRECRWIAGLVTHGRKEIHCVCPFCSADVKGYAWSVAGSGKRCVCGALLTYGIAFNEVRV